MHTTPLILSASVSRQAPLLTAAAETPAMSTRMTPTTAVGTAKAGKATTAITPELLHRRMGHMGYSSLKQLTRVTTGIELKAETEDKPREYKYYTKVKLKKP